MNPNPIKDNLHDNHSDEPTEGRVHLPMPDAENITVLTRELPNDPILPWHRFDSPWLHQQPQSMENDENQPDPNQGTPDKSSSENEHEAIAESEFGEDNGDHVPSSDTDRDQKEKFLNYDPSR